MIATEIPPTQSGNNNCHIASMIVHAKATHRPKLLQSCDAANNMTVYNDDVSPAFIVVVECDSEPNLKQTLADINAMEGVINVNLVYHHCESKDSMSEEL